jgi:hypothetical protein
MISFDWRIDYFNLDDSVLVIQYHIPRTFLSAQKAEVTMGFPILVQVWKFRSLPALKSSCLRDITKNISTSGYLGGSNEAALRQRISAWLASTSTRS